MKETWTWEINMLSDSRKKIIDQHKTRLRHVIKFIEFCDRQERISKKQDGRLVGKIPSFRGEYSQLFFYKLRAFLDYSYHKQFFLFKAFASITSVPPLEKSWLRPWQGTIYILQGMVAKYFLAHFCSLKMLILDNMHAAPPLAKSALISSYSSKKCLAKISVAYFKKWFRLQIIFTADGWKMYLFNILLSIPSCCWVPFRLSKHCLSNTLSQHQPNYQAELSKPTRDFKISNGKRTRSLSEYILIYQSSLQCAFCIPNHSGVRRKFSLGGSWFRIIWWLFVFGVWCLWHHNLTSFPCFQTNVLAKFVDIICIFFYIHSPYFICHCTEYKQSALQVTLSEKNKLNAVKGSETHSSLHQSNLQLQNQATLRSR